MVRNNLFFIYLTSVSFNLALLTCHFDGTDSQRAITRSKMSRFRIIAYRMNGNKYAIPK